MIKNRIELAKYFNKLGFKTGAEIGVSRGYYSKVLCEKNPILKLFCVDSWGVGDRSSIMRDYHLRMYGSAKIRLAPYNTVLVKKLSMDAVKDFEDESLDFVYIDADHEYSHIVEDIASWSKKVKKGGIVSGHDYNTLSVAKAVNAYAETYKYNVNLTGMDQKGLSWWFIKQ